MTSEQTHDLEPGRTVHGSGAGIDGAAIDQDGAAAGRAGRWFVAVGAAAILLIAGACWWTVDRAREAAVADAENRLNLIAEGRADLVRAWRDGVLRDARRFTDSQFLRAFAADTLASDPATGGGEADGDRQGTGDGAEDTGTGRDLRPRRDYLRNLARDFVERTRFERLVATDPAGVPLFASTATVGAIGESLVQRAVDRAAPAYGLIGGDGTAVRLRTALPVVRPQQDAAPETVVGAVLLDVPVRAVVSRATGLPDLATGTETIDLLVRRPDGPRVLHADGLSAWGIEGATPAPDLAFTRARRGDRAVFVAAQAVAGPPWTVAVSTPVASALASHRTFTRAAIGVALGLGLAVVGGLAGGWYRLSASHARERAARERAFAERIERERRLLDQITSSVPELIGLKAPDGGYRYVNTALAAWAARPAEELVGADDGAIFGPTLADRLSGLASDARTRDGAASALLPVYRGGDRRHVRFTVKPLDDGDAEASQLLMVGTDLTDLVRAEENRRADLGRTVTALARAVEMVDPYLAGHSRRLQRLAEAVGRQLRLSEDRITTISLAAQLSQVGKLGVRRELLVSAERHGEAEIQEMRRHIEYADRILGEINFQLPVRNAVIQMHERLDGTGYPAGLSGDEIAQEARVLGAVDVFCARIEPRSYRPAIDSDTALDVLQAHPERYDAEVVDALARVLASPEGEKAIAGLDA